MMINERVQMRYGTVDGTLAAGQLGMIYARTPQAEVWVVLMDHDNQLREIHEGMFRKLSV